MKIFRLLLVDMKLGGILKKGYPALVLLCAFYAYFFHIFTDNLKNIYGIEGAGLGDLLAFVHCGTIPCIRMIQQRDFQISFMWLALIMYEMALPLSYPVSAMENWGYPFVMRTGRRQWWLSKCLYTMGINLISMLLETGTFFICCLIFRLDTDLRWHTRIAEIIFGGADGSGQILTNGNHGYEYGASGDVSEFRENDSLRDRCCMAGRISIYNTSAASGKLYHGNTKQPDRCGRNDSSYTGFFLCGNHCVSRMLRCC